MSNLIKAFRPALFILMIMTLLCGVVYTGVVTGIAHVFFPSKSKGSMITVTLEDGFQKDLGSELIAQQFTNPKYLIGRPSDVSNLSPVSSEQKKMVQDRIEWWKTLEPNNKEEIPMDLVTASGSGVDPYISPSAALYQVSRIAKVRNISEDKVRKIINKNTIKRYLNFIGEPGVNVLKVNLTLDGLVEDSD